MCVERLSNFLSPYNNEVLLTSLLLNGFTRYTEAMLRCVSPLNSSCLIIQPSPLYIHVGSFIYSYSLSNPHLHPNIIVPRSRLSIASIFYLLCRNVKWEMRAFIIVYYIQGERKILKAEFLYWFIIFLLRN